jgi:hypothetical protein
MESKLPPFEYKFVLQSVLFHFLVLSGDIQNEMKISFRFLGERWIQGSFHKVDISRNMTLSFSE